MTPSSATPRRRRRNSVVGGATARALAAGLWRQRHGSSLTRTICSQQGDGLNLRAEKCNQQVSGDQCPWRRRRRRNLHHHGIVLDNSKMEKATKWDRVYEFSSSMVVVEWELDRARARIVKLEEENKRLGRFLWKLEQEKRMERRHRRELEAANGRLLRQLKQQSKARELMEEACSELTREVEADQAEAELLRRRMREEMEEERRMLQMAEVWREERVQMKLSDAKLALEHKYSQLNRLQAETEELMSSNRRHNTTGRARSRPPPPPRLVDDDDDANKVDVDSVFEHFRRKEKEMEHESSSCASPATDLFLAKADDDPFPFSEQYGYDGDPVPSFFSHSNTNGASNRSGTSKNAALIRRLWRSAITESRNKAAGAEQCTSSGSAAKQKQSLQEKLMEARMDDQKEKEKEKQEQ